MCAIPLQMFHGDRDRPTIGKSAEQIFLKTQHTRLLGTSAISPIAMALSLSVSLCVCVCLLLSFAPVVSWQIKKNVRNNVYRF